MGSAVADTAAVVGLVAVMEVMARLGRVVREAVLELSVTTPPPAKQNTVRV
jgi:hypothetical protein